MPETVDLTPYTNFDRLSTPEGPRVAATNAGTFTDNEILRAYGHKPFEKAPPAMGVHRTPEGDKLVKIIGSQGKGPDGGEYLTAEGSPVGIPREEIDFSQLAQAKEIDLDPRIVIKLKDRLKQKLMLQGNVDPVSQKVMGVYEITRYLLASGTPLDKNGDFVPEGMQKLQLMSRLMDLTDEELSQLASERTDSAPDIAEPSYSKLDDFIQQRREANLSNLEKANAPKRIDFPSLRELKTEVKIPTALSEYASVRIQQVKDLVKQYDNGRFSPVPTFKKAYQFFDSTLGKFKEGWDSMDVQKHRRAALGWVGGALATAGSGLLAVDREIMSSPELPAAPAQPEATIGAKQPNRLRRVVGSVSRLSLRGARAAEKAAEAYKVNKGDHLINTTNGEEYFVDKIVKFSEGTEPEVELVRIRDGQFFGRIRRRLLEEDLASGGKFWQKAS